MEGKTLILSVFIMSLFMAHIQVEAKTCCPSEMARNLFTVCRFQSSVSFCAALCGCKIVGGGTCPPGFANDNLQKSGGVNEYCTLGCVSSVCGALQNSDKNEIVNGAVEQCTKACSTFCTKGSLPALETA